MELHSRIARYVNQVIDGALDRERIVGAVVLIAIENNIIYRRAAGVVDRETKRPVREDTIFLLASVTKAMVSAASLSLIDKGHLNLDDPVTKWIPDFRPKLRDGREPLITVRHLMTHTAGLDYGFQAAGDPRYREAKISNGMDFPGLSIEEALERLASVPLLFEPGTAWNYSLATDVLGEVLARAADAPLPDVVRRHVTGPLGMVDTDFIVRDVARLATPHVDGMPRPVRMDDPHEVPTRTGSICFSPSRILNRQSYPSGGAGMAGTAKDLLMLLEAIRQGGGAILSEASARAFASNALPDQLAFKAPGWVFGEPGWTSGLGSFVLYNPAITRTPHEAGTWRGGGAYGHYWFVNPYRRLTVISFTNTAFEGSDGAFPVDLLDAIYYALSAQK